MELTLPSRLNGEAPATINLGEHRSFVIIGANGAGKTRFTTAIVNSLGDKAFRLSALDALYNRRNGSADLPSSLRNRLSPTVVANGDRAGAQATALELLLAQLMHDEMLNLIGYKLAIADHREATLKRTRLDNVISLWQDVFPGNRVLIDSGKILFSRGLDMASYSAVRLSDGERAVLYYAGAVLYAPRHAVIFVDTPEIFLHPTLTTSLWNRLENLRSDCTFCYTTHDPEFASSRNGAPVLWVRDCDTVDDAWDYDLLPATDGISQELYMTLVGTRKPVLFIEGDSDRSIDAKLYPLIFPDFTVRSLGSCNKVIEATRTFNDLSGFHKLDSFGIVDRDRRDEAEVAYLRRKKVMVPEVAEIENMLLLEDIVKAMASVTGHNPRRVFDRVRKTILSLFRADLRQQALLHTRHRVKRTMEYRVDARFTDIANLEEHLSSLLDEISPRRIYEDFCKEFHIYEHSGDYESILRVYNQKSMLSSSNVAQMCGFKNKERYIDGVIALLRENRPEAESIREAVRRCLGASDTIGGDDAQPES
ncbi:MAG: DUF4435 domain-containing protein [Muribaculaceae bacterium]|nr:DUF4435 domain-containing protein [Muribaculaceae bacterium]